jgi:outer membrane protein OmpA-like peptidoglycan-associated protein
MRAGGRIVAALLGTSLVAGCASRDLVVVLPESNGHVGAVVVHDKAHETVLDKAYAADQPGRPATTADAGRVNSEFGEALAALPLPPVYFTLHFPEGSTEIDPTSMATLKAVFAEVRRRKAAEIVITGHTDTVGNDADNDRLSKERAEAIKGALAPILAEQGIPLSAVSTVGRGKRELAVPTPDQTDNAANRRVVITVR